MKSETQETGSAPTVAVSGASGLIGKALCQRLEESGRRVVRLIRGGEARPGTARWHPDQGLIDAAPLEGSSAFVHLAGANIAGGRWTRSRRELLRRSRIEATRKLVRSLGRLDEPPAVFACASAVGIYGAETPLRTDEAASPGTGFLAELTREWEEAAQSAHELCERVLLLRFGVVLSPRGGALGKMLPAFRFGVGGRLSTGRQQMSWIHLADVTRAILFLLEAPQLAGAFNLTAPDPVSNAAFTASLAKALGRPAFLPLPSWLLRLAFGKMAEETLLADQSVVPSRLQDTGFTFAHPRLENALADLLDGGPSRSRAAS